MCTELYNRSPSMRRQNDGIDAGTYTSGRIVTSQREGVWLLAGTEEGAIHVCSVSMADSYTETYFGHVGPVYHVAWSPDSADTFASVSADGAACIWRLHQVETVQYADLKHLQCSFL